MVSQKEKNEKETFEPKPTVSSGEKITINHTKTQKHKCTLLLNFSADAKMWF